MRNSKSRFKHGLVLLTCLVISHFSFAQTQNYVIGCGSGQEIGFCGPDIAEFSWESTPTDPNLILTEEIQTVTPAQSTLYRLITIDLQGNENSYEYLVYVIESIDLSVEDDLTECMEERPLTFSATIEMNLQFGFPGPVVFNFNYTDASAMTVTQSEFSTTPSTSNTFTVEQVINPSHHYSMLVDCEVSFEVYGITCTSSFMTIEVYQLWIDKFEDAATGKDWKIVVNKDINYDANASSDCNNWEWKFPNLDGGSLIWPLVGTHLISGTLKVPESNLPVSSSPYGVANGKFGDVNGNLRVSCQDGEGNTHIHYLDLNQSKKVKIFYEAKVANFNDPSVPNWYYYYKDALGGGTFNYGGSCPAHPDAAGYSNVGGGESSIQICDKAFDPGQRYIITMIDPGDGLLGATGGSIIYDGFQYFSGVVIHEKEHANNQITGGPSAGDADSDYIHSTYEMTTSHTDPALPYSARDKYMWSSEPEFLDAEIFAGGPVEQGGIFAAMPLLLDWATDNGYNW